MYYFSSFTFCIFNPFQHILLTLSLKFPNKRNNKKRDPPFFVQDACEKWRNCMAVEKRGIKVGAPSFTQRHKGSWQRWGGLSTQHSFVDITECCHVTLFHLCNVFTVSFTGKWRALVYSFYLCGFLDNSFQQLTQLKQTNKPEVQK